MSEPGKKSKYAEKRERGQQMYGPGCCAHKIQITEEMRAKMFERKREVERREREAAKARVFNRKFGNQEW